MITLHRLGRAEDPFQLNPDLIVTVEATPDTVVTLATTAKVLVSETPEQVNASTREWYAKVLAEAMCGGSPEQVLAPHARVPVHAHAG